MNSLTCGEKTHSDGVPHRDRTLVMHSVHRHTTVPSHPRLHPTHSNLIHHPHPAHGSHPHRGSVLAAIELSRGSGIERCSTRCPRVLLPIRHRHRSSHIYVRGRSRWVRIVDRRGMMARHRGIVARRSHLVMSTRQMIIPCLVVSGIGLVHLLRC